ncbi:Pvc16 family protein (plasmid) [Pseudoalteromonas sp. T1lg65]|uniref:Pvc16 family protein n=1 Tax=Pseudoalteromonas sp. T1lg65 TaxID=2077101 RepID=UPI003F7A7E3D
MDPTLIYKVQQALKALLEQTVLPYSNNALLGLGGSQTKLSFQAPDKAFFDKMVSDIPVINCYLIGISEDIQRRQSEPPRTQINFTQTHRTRFIEPRFISLSYMMTVWSKDEEQGAEIEHLFLSHLIAGLGKFDFIPEDIMQAQQIDISPYGVRSQLFGNEHSEKITGQVWQALGSTPKPTVIYSLSLPMPVFEPVQLPIIKEMNNKLDNKPS